MEGQASLPPSYAGTRPSKWGWDLDLPFLLTTQPMFAEQPYGHFLLVPVSPWLSEDTIAPSWTCVHGSILPAAWPGLAGVLSYPGTCVLLTHPTLPGMTMSSSRGQGDRQSTPTSRITCVPRGHVVIGMNTRACSPNPTVDGGPWDESGCVPWDKSGWG